MARHYDINPEKARDAALSAIKAALKLFPSMRIGQLITNIQDQHGPDLFYMTNDELAKAIIKFCRANTSCLPITTTSV